MFIIPGLIQKIVFVEYSGPNTHIVCQKKKSAKTLSLELKGKFKVKDKKFT